MVKIKSYAPLNRKNKSYAPLNRKSYATYIVYVNIYKTTERKQMIGIWEGAK